MLKSRIALLVVTTLALLGIAAGAPPKAQAIKITGRFYRVVTAINTQAIKAIGSAETKATPTILQVTPAEADRIAGIVTKGGGSLVGSPTVVTNVDQRATISTEGDDNSYSIDVVPSNKGSDTITLNFKLTLTSVSGGHKLTRSAKGMARVQEAKALLIIVNPREGQSGFMAVVRAAKTK